MQLVLRTGNSGRKAMEDSSTAEVTPTTSIADGHLLQSVLNTVNDGVFTFNQYGHITLFNPAAEAMFGYDSRQARTLQIFDLLPDLQGVLSAEFPPQEAMRTIETKGLNSKGALLPLELSISISDSSPQYIYTAVVKDISQRKLNEQELQDFRNNLEEMVEERTRELRLASRRLEILARIDSLTGVANRRFFNDTFSKEISRANRSQTMLALIICDIDYFKSYNDHYGHVAGDQCIKKVAATIGKCFQRAGELTARYGGEEFAVILPNTSHQEALAMADRMRQAVADLHLEHKASTSSKHVTISAGAVALIPNKYTKAEGIIEQADSALYMAKRSGRDRVAAPPIMTQAELLKSTA